MFKSQFLLNKNSTDLRIFIKDFDAGVITETNYLSDNYKDKTLENWYTIETLQLDGWYKVEDQYIDVEINKGK